MEREAFVYMDFPTGPVLVGRLWSRIRKGRETASFEYDAGWLARADRFALEPALILAPGPYHTGTDRPMFGPIGDSAPDRWGRVLMRRAERKARSARNAHRDPCLKWTSCSLLMTRCVRARCDLRRKKTDRSLRSQANSGFRRSWTFHPVSRQEQVSGLQVQFVT
jgi:hypothetical protein